MTCYTALITPFDTEGKLDEEGLSKLISLQNSIDGIVVLGSTGESATLSKDEKKTIIKLARSSPLPIMVGCGTYSTEETIQNILMAADLGADSALVVMPYYNKPTQDGLYKHIIRIAESSPLPIVLYNIPGRTMVNLSVETVKRLIQHKNVVGIKESSSNISQINALLAIKRERADFSVYAGDDILTFPMMVLGGDGVISVMGNLIPAAMSKLVKLCREGSYKLAQDLHFKLLPLFEISQITTNPIPIKACLQLAGLPGGEPRLPLTPLDASYLSQIKDVMGKVV